MQKHGESAQKRKYMEDLPVDNHLAVRVSEFENHLIAEQFTIQTLNATEQRGSV